MRFDLHSTLKQAFVSDRFIEANFSVLGLDAFQEAGTFDSLYTALVEQEKISSSFTEEQREQQVRIKISATLEQLERWRNENFPGKLLTIRYLQLNRIDEDHKIHGTLSVLISAPSMVKHQNGSAIDYPTNTDTDAKGKSEEIIDNEEIYHPSPIDVANAEEYQFDVNFGDLFPGPVNDDNEAFLRNNPAALSITVSEKIGPSVPASILKLPRQAKHINILLVDDGSLEIKMLKMAIKTFFGKDLMKHVALEVATNGDEAVAKVEALINNQGQSFDFITMDYHMPVKNGHEATEEIKELERHLNEKSTIVGVSNLEAGSEAHVNFTGALGGENNLLGKPILAHKVKLEAKLTPLKDQLELAIQESMGENCSNQSAASAALSM